MPQGGYPIPPAELVVGPFGGELLDVRLSSDELNEKEREIIRAYRSKPELQPAVDILLGISSEL